MKLKQKTVYSVLILAIIAIISALTLSLVNMFTEVDEGAALAEKIAQFYPEATVTDTELAITEIDNDYAVILHAILMSDGAMAVHVRSLKAYSSKGLELLVFIKDEIIVRVSKYKAAETPGIGSKVVSEAYLAGFEGKNVSEFPEYPYKDSVVDAVSGATRTSNGVKYAVSAVANFYVSWQEVA